MRVVCAIALLLVTAQIRSDDGIELAERKTYLGLRTLGGVFATYHEATGPRPRHPRLGGTPLGGRLPPLSRRLEHALSGIRR